MGESDIPVCTGLHPPWEREPPRVYRAPLCAFLGSRVIDDYLSGNIRLTCVDMVIAMLSLLYYSLYASGTIWPEKARRRTPKQAGVGEISG